MDFDVLFAADVKQLPLITLMAAGFSAAWVMGLFTQWLRLSPIVGYLLAGVLIGPHTPWVDIYQGDHHLAHEVAEIGVILLMFGVGLHFHLEDLLAVKTIAIPGALTECLIATTVGVVVFTSLGFEPKTGMVIGISMAVASTVVLIRTLTDANVLNSPQGHIAVGWLLVEDMLTVIVLVLIPILGDGGGEGGSEPATGIMANPLVAVGVAMLKLGVMVAAIMVLGSKIVPWALMQVTRLRSRELFTLTVMVFSITIAAGAYVLFDASMALGAFLAGMVVALSPVSHQAAADALPLRDAFAVLFFVSVGMVFDPMFLLEEPLLMAATLGIVLLVKPLMALLIVSVLGHSVRTALTVAFALAQIGEFSFILSNLAGQHGLMTEAGHNAIVGAAIISITLNPMLFRSIDSVEAWLRGRPRLWRLLNARARKRVVDVNKSVAGMIATIDPEEERLAILVGYGPVGRTVDGLLEEAGFKTVVIEMNMDTVLELKEQGQPAIYGDASRDSILELAGVNKASHLVLTLPQSAICSTICSHARNLNPHLKIFVRARYLREREDLEQAGATASIFEEAEAALALARLVLVDSGASEERIDHAMREIRMRLILDNFTSLHSQTVRDIMIPWERVSRLPSDATLEEVCQQVNSQHYSRWPVVEPASGEPMGYLLAKDLLDLLDGDDGGKAWTDLLRPLHAVAPYENIETALGNFQERGLTICVVKDRKATLGLLTVEDIIEQLVGHIGDEYSRQDKLRLQDVAFTNHTLLNLSATTSEEAIAEMVASIPRGMAPNAAEITELVVARERELPTVLGYGVAVPHARCPDLFGPLAVIGRSAEGIVFDRQSPETVHLVFLLLTPIERPDAHVQLLGQVASLVGNPATRQALRYALSASEITDILASAASNASKPQ
jgi:CPA2 family monovalent cation:H+ antiporter-2